MILGLGYGGEDMDNDFSAEQLRALAFASIPEAPKTFSHWVRVENDREEGEVSSDEDLQLAENTSMGKNRRHRRRVALQSAAPPTGVPHKNHRVPTTRAAANTFLGLENPTSPTYPHGRSDKNLFDVHPGPSQRIREEKNAMKSNGDQVVNPFLIRFSDEDSESEAEQVASMDMEQAAHTSLNPTSASLSVEISRMRKQIEAIERAKGKSLPALKSTRPFQSSPGNQHGSVTGSECLKKQTTSKELHQRQHSYSTYPTGGAFKYQRTGNQLQQQQQPVLLSELMVTETTNRVLGENRHEEQQEKQRKLQQRQQQLEKHQQQEKQLQLEQLQELQQRELLQKQERERQQQHEQEREKRLQQQEVREKQRQQQQQEQEKQRQLQQEQEEQRQIQKQKVQQQQQTHDLLQRKQQQQQHLQQDQLEQPQRQQQQKEEEERHDKVASDDVSTGVKRTLDHTEAQAQKKLKLSLAVTGNVTAAAKPATGKELVAAVLTLDTVKEKSALEDLQAQEDALDSELQTAQSLRHMCEVRERLARKALREAQEALRAVNSKCLRLQQRREVVSLQVKAAELKFYSDSTDEDWMLPFLKTSSGTGDAVPEDHAKLQHLETPPLRSTNEVPAKESTVLELEKVVNQSLPVEEEERSGKDLENTTGSQPLNEQVALSNNELHVEEKGEEGSSTAKESKPRADSPEASPKGSVISLSSSDGVTAAAGKSGGSSMDEASKPGPDNLAATNQAHSVLPFFSRCIGTPSNSTFLIVFGQACFKTGSSGPAEPERRPELVFEGAGVYESPVRSSRLDPFKPMCKYEHRGKCNDELCTFQHLSRQIQNGKTVSSSTWMEFTGPAPTYYRIGSYVMSELDLTPDKVHGFPAYKFLASVSLQRSLSEYMPCILERKTDFDVKDMPELVPCGYGVDECLELVLSIAHPNTSMKNSNYLNNALYFLSRGLEDNRTSISLWVVYLLLYPLRGSSTGDMFLRSVKEISSSYELWCLLLSSRKSLQELLESFDHAILAMCKGSSRDSERSSCILDLTLRMLHTFVTSESSEAVEWIEDLVAGGERGTKRKSVLVLMSSLLPSDGCILWVSCAYISAYGSLPSRFISRLGCKQDLPLDLEWGEPLLVTDVSRDRVWKVFESGAAWLSSTSAALPQQTLLVNWMKLLVALGELDRALTYGRQIAQQHPDCVRLTVLLANVQKLRGGSKSGLAVFQSALSNWPMDRGGAQALWNQYAGHALKWEGDESALLILRNCLSSTVGTYHQELDEFHKEASFKNAEDWTFYLVNFALLQAMSAKIQEAQQALEKALVSSEAGLHCLLEYTAFRLSDTGGFSNFKRAFLDVLDRSCLATQLHSKPTPLNRGFLRSIKKRRVQRFIDELLGPAPTDYTFINTMLKMCFGAELFPKDGFDLQSVLYFLAGVLDLFPGNYEIALALCRAVRHAMRTQDSRVATSTSAWAASLLLASLRLSTSTAPVESWLEAGELLREIGLEECCENFYRHALVVYPFSASLWRCHIAQCKRTGSDEAAIKAAKQAGMRL